MLDYYLISLKSNENLASTEIGKTLESAKVDYKVKGVDGRKLNALDYFRLGVRDGLILTPSELGCKMSHQEALREIVSRNKSGVIFEDDIVAKDGVNFNHLCEQLSKLQDEKCIVFLGGLDGLSSIDRMFGKQVLGFDNKFFKLHYLNAPWLLRTCCYMVTVSAANALVIEGVKNYRADDWALLLDKSYSVYYYPLFKHPPDMTNSLIEPERILANRSVMTGFRLIVHRLRALCIFSCLLMMGYKRIV